MVSGLLELGTVSISALASPLQTSFYLQQFLNGLVLGMILVLISLGLTIIFGFMGTVNFAHGDILLVGTYVAWVVSSATGSFVVAFLAAVLVAGLIGAAVERWLIRFTYGTRGPLLQLLLTYGIAELLRGLVQMIWGPNTHNIAVPPWGRGTFDLVLFNYPVYRLFIIVTSAVLVALIYLIFTRTDVGLVIRAGTQDREMVDALGINVSRTFMIVFMIGAGLAGGAGALIGPIRGAFPTLGIELLIPAFVVVVIGGLGSFRGSVLAGILVGELQVMTGIFYSEVSQSIIFLFMAVVLLVRPRGLFGREGVIE